MKNKIVHILVVLFFLHACNLKHEQSHVEKNVYYTCSMDPQVMETHPGICPICKMELTKVNNAQQDKTKLHLTNNQILLANIKVIEVNEGAINEEISLSGKIVTNENATQIISSRFDGRIDMLYAKTVGVNIQKGELLYKIYSEELIATQKEYLSFIEKMKTGINDKENYRGFAEAAKNKLLYWGFTEREIKTIETEKNIRNSISVYSKTEGVIQEINVKEGEYVMEGTPLFRLSDLSEVWIEAQVYSKEMSLVEKDKEVSIIVDAYADERIPAKIDFVNPEMQLLSKINIVRCHLENKDKKYIPGMRASVKITVSTNSSVVLPINAVIQNGDEGMVWIQNEDGTFQPKKVETGIQNATDIEITNGLRKGKKVVVKGVYLLNSEYVLKYGTSPMAGHDMSKM